MAVGKYAKFISDRSGMEFPYKEMVKEWNGSRVHVSEFEEKHPQLEPKTHRGDPQGLQDARPARTEPATQNLLPGNPFSLTSGSGTVTVVRCRNVQEYPGIVYISTYENSSGFSITVTGTNNYTFALGVNASVTENSGGMTVTAGPVTLTP